jgi:hypothetical protein
MENNFIELFFLEENYTDGYGTWPIPHPLDEKILNLIERWKKLDVKERIETSNFITSKYHFVFLAFSERMASNSVRKINPQYIADGLIALGLDGWAFDWRDNVLVLSLLYHSTVLIGAEPKTIFTNAGKLLSPNVQKAFTLFLNRNPEDKAIAAMGYVESMDKDGFRYLRTW